MKKSMLQWTLTILVSTNLARKKIIVQIFTELVNTLTVKAGGGWVSFIGDCCM